MWRRSTEPLYQVQKQRELGRFFLGKPQARFADKSLKVIYRGERKLCCVICVSFEKSIPEAETMRVQYDAQHDIAYIRFSRKKSDGAI
jgi:uncharacterized protein YuzE